MLHVEGGNLFPRKNGFVFGKQICSGGKWRMNMICILRIKTE